MNQSTIPDRILHQVPKFRTQVEASRTARLQARSMFIAMRRALGEGDTKASKALSRESADLREDSSIWASKARRPAERSGLLDELRSHVLDELRRLPSLLPSLDYRASWSDFLCLVEASRILWDRPPVEWDAALSVLRESKPWRALNKTRDLIRGKKRTAKGVWRGPKAAKAAKERRHKREASQTEEDRAKIRSQQRISHATRQWRLRCMDPLPWWSCQSGVSEVVPESVEPVRWLEAA